MTILKQDIFICAGADWQPVMQWLSDDTTHKIITAVQIGLPTLLTAVAHGLIGTARIPVWITDVKGPRGLNTDGYKGAEPQWATVVDGDTLAVDCDTGALQAYASGGVLTYHPSVDLTYWTARQEIRSGINAVTAANILTTENGGIALGSDGTISRHIDSLATGALGLFDGIYKLELTDPGGIVTRFAEGAAHVSPDFIPDP